MGYESDPGCIAVGKPSAPSSSVSPSPSSKDKHEATTPSPSSNGKEEASPSPSSLSTGTTGSDLCPFYDRSDSPCIAMECKNHLDDRSSCILYIVEYCKQYESDPGCIAVGKPSAPSSSVSPSPSSKDKHEATTPSSSSYSGTPDETTPSSSSSNHKDEDDHKDERVPSPSIRSPSP